MIDMNRLNDIERRINEIEHFKEKKSEKENFKTFKNLEKFNDFKEDDEKKYFMIDNMFNEMFYFNMIMPGAIKDLNNARNKCMQILYSLMKIFDHSTTKFDEYIAKHMDYDGYLKNLVEILQKFIVLKKSISSIENEEALNECFNESYKLQKIVESLALNYKTVTLKVDCNFSDAIEELIEQRRNTLILLKQKEEKEKKEKQELFNRIETLETFIKSKDFSELLSSKNNLRNYPLKTLDSTKPIIEVIDNNKNDQINEEGIIQHSDFDLRTLNSSIVGKKKDSDQSIVTTFTENNIASTQIKEKDKEIYLNLAESKNWTSTPDKINTEDPFDSYVTSPDANDLSSDNEVSNTPAETINNPRYHSQPGLIDNSDSNSSGNSTGCIIEVDETDKKNMKRKGVLFEHEMEEHALVEIINNSDSNEFDSDSSVEHNSVDTEESPNSMKIDSSSNTIDIFKKEEAILRVNNVSKIETVNIVDKKSDISPPNENSKKSPSIKRGSSIKTFDIEKNDVFNGNINSLLDDSTINEKIEENIGNNTGAFDIFERNTENDFDQSVESIENQDDLLGVVNEKASVEKNDFDESGESSEDEDDLLGIVSENKPVEKNDFDQSVESSEDEDDLLGIVNEKASVEKNDFDQSIESSEDEDDLLGIVSEKPSVEKNDFDQSVESSEDEDDLLGIVSEKPSVEKNDFDQSVESSEDEDDLLGIVNEKASVEKNDFDQSVESSEDEDDLLGIVNEKASVEKNDFDQSIESSENEDDLLGIVSENKPVEKNDFDESGESSEDEDDLLGIVNEKESVEKNDLSISSSDDDEIKPIITKTPINPSVLYGNNDNSFSMSDNSNSNFDISDDSSSDFDLSPPQHNTKVNLKESDGLDFLDIDEDFLDKNLKNINKKLETEKANKPVENSVNHIVSDKKKEKGDFFDNDKESELLKDIVDIGNSPPNTKNNRQNIIDFSDSDSDSDVIELYSNESFGQTSSTAEEFDNRVDASRFHARNNDTTTNSKDKGKIVETLGFSPRGSSSTQESDSGLEFESMHLLNEGFNPDISLSTKLQSSGSILSSNSGSMVPKLNLSKVSDVREVNENLFASRDKKNNFSENSTNFLQKLDLDLASDSDSDIDLF
eukprot:TRINITY_DN2749_c0_g1_i1.p1 TRINITY_DN2749_c0_g1~~TRINITY_DN2749_c0_g1_i1.p1  ORF type:complete len:1121 (+),score=408.14 TRINITY_DN2749_c0_g1_i1:1-3363(+)